MNHALLPAFVLAILALGCGENNSSSHYSYQPSARPEANPESAVTNPAPVIYNRNDTLPSVPAPSLPKHEQAAAAPKIEPDHATLAIAALQKLADEGDAQACWMLGLRFELGQGVATNAVTAYQWVALAAVRGSWVHRSIMQKDLDRLAPRLTAPQIEQARKPAKDFLATMIEAQTTAADKGNKSAQFALGMRLFHGEGVAADKMKATEWLEKAAEQGHIGASALLGRMYLNGDTVPKDMVKGYRMLERAAANGSTLAWADLAGAPKTMTAAELAKASKAAAKLLEKKVALLEAVADKGDAVAQFKLGLLFYLGTEIPKNVAAAEEWFRKASEQGHVEAPALLAGMFFSGEGVKKSFAETYKWHGIAKARGNPTAAASQNEVAKLLAAGEKTAADKDVTAWLAANPKRN